MKGTSMDPQVVSIIQTWLNASLTPSPELKVDGIMGPKTKAAIELFLTQDVLPWTGPFGPFTAAILHLLLKN